jgi:hypothetical protein
MHRFRKPSRSAGSHKSGELRSFSPGGYEILDSALDDRGEVMLWSRAGLAPERGELFTLERNNAICDLSVVQVTGHNPGWSALCRRVDIPWG